MTTTMLDQLELIFKTYSSPDMENSPPVSLTTQGWHHVLSCITQWASVCSTARMMREEEYWHGFGTILHYLLESSVHLPLYILDVILKIKDCKGYPLGIYMCTDSDSYGNFPIHIAVENVSLVENCCRNSGALIERLMYTDLDALMHKNHAGLLPIHIFLQNLHHQNSNSRTKAFVLFKKMRLTMKGACLESSELGTRTIDVNEVENMIDESIISVLNSSYLPSNMSDSCNKTKLHRDVLSNMLFDGHWPTDFLLEDVARLCPESLTMISEETKLYPFMTAAMDINGNLDTIYQLLRQAPYLVLPQQQNKPDIDRSDETIQMANRKKQSNLDENENATHDIKKKRRLPSPSSVMFSTFPSNQLNGGVSNPLVISPLSWSENRLMDENALVLQNQEMSTLYHDLWI